MKNGEIRRIFDDYGAAIRSAILIESSESGISLVFQARGGAMGAKNERNPEYIRGLDQVLSRLVDQNVVLLDAEIDTQVTRKKALPQEQRRLWVQNYPFPVELRKVEDLVAFRRLLCAAQRPIGRKPNATGLGNNNKRMRLQFKFGTEIDELRVVSQIAIAGPDGRGSIDDLHEELFTLHRRIGEATGGEYRPNYLLRSLKRMDGLSVARNLLGKSKSTGGFEKLIAASRADLTVEAIVLKRRFSHLFTVEERLVAFRKLEMLEDSAFPRSQSFRIGDVFAGDVPDEGMRTEGACKKITVNRYERDKRARASCIKHHGAFCHVCGLRFEERYGQIGIGFIHVHHKRPLHTIKKNYKVNPKKDLIPVCPNCHAMLHTSKPPLDLEQLKSMIVEGVSTAPKRG